MKKIAVFFPGKGYSCERPLLKESRKKYETLGYECFSISFSEINFSKFSSLEMIFQVMLREVIEKLSSIDFSSYAEIVFVAKSIGTEVAMAYQKEFVREAKVLLLTPLLDTFLYAIDKKYILGLFIGTEDSYSNYKDVLNEANSLGYPCTVIMGVGHSLEAKDIKQNKEIMNQVLACIR